MRRRSLVQLSYKMARILKWRGLCLWMFFPSIDSHCDNNLLFPPCRALQAQGKVRYILLVWQESRPQFRHTHEMPAMIEAVFRTCYKRKPAECTQPSIEHIQTMKFSALSVAALFGLFTQSIAEPLPQTTVVHCKPFLKLYYNPLTCVNCSLNFWRRRCGESEYPWFTILNLTDSNRITIRHSSFQFLGRIMWVLRAMFYRLTIYFLWIFRPDWI